MQDSSEAYLNISTNLNSAGRYGIKNEFNMTDFATFAKPRNSPSPRTSPSRSYPGQIIGQMPLLVPPKFRGTPLDILTDLNGPYGLDLTRRGHLVVSEFCDHCISIWDLATSKKVSSIGSPGVLKGQLCYPAGVVMSPRDTILVVDCYNDRVQEFTLDGECLSCVGEHGSDILQFDKPRGITFDNTGLVYIADRYNHRVQVLNPDLTFSHLFGSPGVKPGHFDTPYDIAYDSQGMIYVTDCGNHRVQVFTQEGRFQSIFGIEGKKPGELLGPMGITIEDNIVYITEYLNSRISMFTTQGAFIDTKMHKKSKDPYGIRCTMGNGNLIFSDFSNNRVVILERKS